MPMASNVSFIKKTKLGGFELLLIFAYGQEQIIAPNPYFQEVQYERTNSIQLRGQGYPNCTT